MERIFEYISLIVCGIFGWFVGKFEPAFPLIIIATRFVVKNNEVEAADWGQSDTYNGQPGIYIEPGGGTQTFYLAIYNLFQDIHSQHMTSGGTVWRIRLGISSTEDLDVEYGSLGDNHLNITVSPLNS